MTYPKVYGYLCLLLRVVGCIALSETVSASFYCSFHVAGYYPDYYYTQLPVSQIRYDKLTDVIYFSIYPNANGSLNQSEINLSRQQQLVQTAHQKDVRVSICVGGWGLSGNFSAVATNSQTRDAFIVNLVQYCLTYGLDGINLDWEPISTIQDKQNYTTLIQELKTAMQPHGLTLSVAVFAQGSEFYATAIPAIDWLYIMAYDMARPHSTYEDAVSALQHWERFGVPRSKIILGLPFYGRNGDINSWIYYPYKDIVSQYAPAPSVDEVGGINFNGIHTTQAKTEYIVQNGFGGVMIWELTNDSSGPTSLLTAIAQAVHKNIPPDFNCDNKVDMIDFRNVAINWHRNDCNNENNCCCRSDLDSSGNVDLSDLVIFCENWLHQSSN